MTVFSDLINTLGWTLVHFIWQGAVIGLLFVLLNWLLQKSSAGTRYSAGLFCLFLTFLTPLLTFFWLSGQVGTIPVAVSSAGSMSGIMLTQNASLLDVLSNNIEHVLPWIVVLWAVGVSGLSARALIGWRLVQHYRTRNVHLSPEWINARVQSLAENFGIRQTITVMQSLRVNVPTVIGWLKPVILLPVSVINRLDREQLEMVLAHELGHIRRYDYIVNLLQVFLETVLFYHPVVRWMSNQIRQERENCCDDLVIQTCGKPVIYAKALASLEEVRGTGHIEPAVAATGGDLLARVKRIVHPRQSAHRPAKGFMLTAIIVAAVATLGAQSKIIDTADSGFEFAGLSSVTLENAQSHDAVPNRASWVEGVALLPEYTARAIAAKDAAEKVLAQARTLRAKAEQPVLASASPTEQVMIDPVIQMPIAQAAPIAEHRPVEIEATVTALPETRKIVTFEATKLVSPDYPGHAIKDGIEGSVVVEFTVDKRGRPTDVEVVDAYPPDTFERYAVKAMKKSRFKKPDSFAGAIRLQRTYDFVLSNDPVLLADASMCRKIGNDTCASLEIGKIQRVVDVNSTESDSNKPDHEES